MGAAPPTFRDDVAIGSWGLIYGPRMIWMMFCQLFLLHGLGMDVFIPGLDV